MRFVANLTLEQGKALSRQLDEVCKQAQELAAALKAAMLQRARNDQQLLTPRPSERRRKPRRPAKRN